MDHAAEPDDFAITAQISLVEQRFRTLKHNDMFGVFDQRGDIRPGLGGTEGIYFNDTRYLSEFELVLAGQQLVLLSSTLRDDNATLTCDLSNPDLPRIEPDGLLNNLVHVQRSRFLWNGVCHERISIRNYDTEPRTLPVEIRYGADFVDLFEVRGMSRPRHGTHEPAQVTRQTVLLAYTGLDDRRRTTCLRFDPAPDRIDEGRSVFEVSLAPGARTLIFVEIGCDRPSGSPRPSEQFLGRMVEQRRWMRQRSATATGIETSNELFNEAMRRAISDLTMLTTEKPTGPYPYAGIPWFSTAFGRDAILTALNVLWMDPSIASGVLGYLAANQATATDPDSDAEPGKILHEVRRGEMAELREVPFRRYYGSVDATPLFVVLAGAYLDRTGDVTRLEPLWPSLRAAVGWLDLQSGRDPDGFVTYFRQTPEGLANQGWKDSFDSISHADGTLATGPIALCEVQGYVYAARDLGGRPARRLGHPDFAEEQDRSADRLRETFDQRFWCEDLGTYALALDGQRHPCRVRSSNAGHLLMTGICSPGRARRVADGLMESRSYNGWGVRTLAADEARYNPMSYHNGSVWPHDNAVIALGLASYGLKAQAERIFEGLFDASLYVDLRRLPELFCGFVRRRGQGPTFYPVACSPQAWAATALHAALGANLGVSFNPAERSVVFDTPRLPEFLTEVTLHNLALGEARISVVLRRTGREVAMNVLSRTGRIHAVLRS